MKLKVHNRDFEQGPLHGKIDFANIVLQISVPSQGSTNCCHVGTGLRESGGRERKLEEMERKREREDRESHTICAALCQVTHIIKAKVPLKVLLISVHFLPFKYKMEGKSV